MPVRTVLVDDVYLSLKALLMDLQVAPGSRINMDALARQLSVSITPIREAFSRLEADGLVLKLALRGYTAAPLLSASEFEDLYEMRLQLEPWAAGRAAVNATEENLRELAREFESSRVAPEDRSYEGYRAFAEHDARLHRLIYQIAGNDMILSALDRLHAHLHLFRLNYSRGIGEESIAEHRAIIDAVTGRDPEAAERAMREHLTQARQRLRPALSGN
jgi:DNA-binding GntR family transcriptional regulator